LSIRLTKNRKIILAKIDNKRKYSLEEASSLVKEISFVKFDASVDVSVRLRIDPHISSSSNQMGRETVRLPHGTGKNIRILALVTKDKELESKEAGANYVGLDDYIEKIKSGWMEIDVIITMPLIMNKLVSIGKILGPKGLMPNPRLDTVSTNPGKSIKEIKSGKISFKVDRFGIIHTSIGRVSFSPKCLSDNLTTLMKKIIRVIRSKSYYYKGIKSIYLSTTMSNSISLDVKSFVKE
jgi:large subunit ribosomal protein L1